MSARAILQETQTLSDATCLINGSIWRRALINRPAGSIVSAGSLANGNMCLAACGPHYWLVVIRAGQSCCASPIGRLKRCGLARSAPAAIGHRRVCHLQAAQSWPEAQPITAPKRPHLAPAAPPAASATRLLSGCPLTTGRLDGPHFAAQNGSLSLNGLWPPKPCNTLPYDVLLNSRNHSLAGVFLLRQRGCRRRAKEKKHRQRLVRVLVWT